MEYDPNVTGASNRLISEVLALPEEARREVVDAVLDSFIDEAETLSPAWQVEIAKRIDEAMQGKVKPVPWDQVEARIRKVLKED